MTTYTPKQIESFLCKNGRVVDHKKGSHVVLYHEETKKRTVIPFHGNRKDLAEGTLLVILRQTGFTKRDIDLSK